MKAMDIKHEDRSRLAFKVCLAQCSVQARDRARVGKTCQEMILRQLRKTRLLLVDEFIELLTRFT